MTQTQPEGIRIGNLNGVEWNCWREVGESTESWLARAQQMAADFRRLSK